MDPSNIGEVKLFETCSKCGFRQSVPTSNEKSNLHCGQCESLLSSSISEVSYVSLFYALFAFILYIPANIFPIMSMTYMGRYTENTVLSGVVALYREQKWAIATLVFAVSIVIPATKILFVLYLYINTTLYEITSPKVNSRIYRLTQSLGKWSMLDVFLVSIFVAIVKLEDMATVNAGPGLIPFASVVVLTMLATSNFHPSMIWKEK